MKNKSLAAFIKAVQENPEGKLEGGFVFLNVTNNVLITGGNEANNCSGSNCADGCASNLAAGCGHTINTVARCGTSTTISHL